VNMMAVVSYIRQIPIPLQNHSLVDMPHPPHGGFQINVRLPEHGSEGIPEVMHADMRVPPAVYGERDFPISRSRLTYHTIIGILSHDASHDSNAVAKRESYQHEEANHNRLRLSFA